MTLDFHLTETSKKITPNLREEALKAFQKIKSEQPGGLKDLLLQMSQVSQWQNSLGDLKKKFPKRVLVGIGGSSLGVRVLAEVFGRHDFSFVDNVDARDFEYQIKHLNLAETLWIFTSKSGKTIETLAALDWLQQIYQERNLQLSRQAIVITETKKSDLYDWAQSHQVPCFEIPISVGGRFSVLSNVGLVPGELMDLNLTQLRAGAEQALSNQKLVVDLTAQFLESFARGEWVTVLWSYCSGLRNFGAWWQQLWAESLAKSISRNGGAPARASTPLPLIGATDQHSVLQQVMEGYRDKFVLFLRVGDSEQGQWRLKKATLKETQNLQGKTLGQLLAAEATGTQMALEEVGVSNATLQIPHLDEKGLGFLLMTFQLVVMCLGEAMNIHTFNQPGVELGKIQTQKILSQKELLQ